MTFPSLLWKFYENSFKVWKKGVLKKDDVFDDVYDDVDDNFDDD